MIPAPFAQTSQWFALRCDTRGMMPQTSESARGEIRGRPTGVRFPVEVALSRNGYLPRTPTESWSRRRNRFTRMRVTTTRALIPGLVMVERHADAPDVNWWHLMQVPYVLGIYGLVRNLSAADAARLMAMSDELWRAPDDPFLLRPGDRAEVLAGPFRGLTAEIDSIQCDDVPEPVAKALVEIFGRATIVQFRLQDLKGAK